MNFQDLIDDPNILRAIEELGFSTPTPIQEKAIPEIVKKRDLQAAARTGTGKTAAFMLPALSLLTKPSSGKGPRILVLVPTRELAMQVAAETAKLSRYLPNVVSVCIYGGVPYPIQNRKLIKHHDILIATPGRLIDHIEQKRIHLNNIEMLILDEADRMLDMGFIEPVDYIASLMPKSRQTLMFSATYGKSVLKLAKKLLTNPVEVNIEHEISNPEQIEQHLHATHNLEHKYQLLDKILEDTTINQVIVFSATKVQVDQITDKLRQKGMHAAALHGDMNQRQRSRTMQQLRDGKIKILVATDVAARGIDVQTISHVINFDLPNSLEDYIHRIGRTGRAGAKGIALSFTTNRDHHLRKQIERLTGVATTVTEGPSDGPRRPFKQGDNFKRKPRSNSKPFPGGGGGGGGARFKGRFNSRAR